MTKLENTTKEQRDKLAGDLSVVYMLEDSAKYAERRLELTAEFAALTGNSPLGATNFLWDLTEDDAVNSPYMFQLRVAELLNAEAEVYRRQAGRASDLAALTKN